MESAPITNIPCRLRYFVSTRNAAIIGQSRLDLIDSIVTPNRIITGITHGRFLRCNIVGITG
jgi:hypothetical protein